jgi:hypothetical protein
LRFSRFHPAGQICESVPPRIDRTVLAVTASLVQILSATRAKSFAVFATERPSGQGEQHLFPHDVLQHEAALFIIPDFGLRLRNGSFSRLAVDPGGTEQQVELALNVLRNRVDTPGTEHLEVAGIFGTETDIVHNLARATMLRQQLRPAVYGQSTHLADIRSIVKRGKFLVQLQWLFFQ